MQEHAQIIIRPARAADAPAIGAILREIEWLPEAAQECRAEIESLISENLASCLDDNSHTALVAEYSAGDVVGYIAAHWTPYLMLPGPEGYITELFVLESERKKGIGRSLLAEVKKMALERGCFRLRLVTGRGRGSYQFYKKLGWVERTGIADLVLFL